ncbi:hypothetical protein K5V07_03080 [Flavobacterium sp. CHNK8]|uniref:hypothetical protein n=1 Tax=Flavobacterium sp. CHNK8 TaxID=2871165 RepID=UPI001C8DAB35|nr:hypothetical protein [Flavobacterium sp. CHNK8]QZK89525.1 hypothetical protein K5V07_03080 [Flavobacterium sp. CHNK8]
MKKIAVSILLLFVTISFGQTVNNYKAVIVPVKYEWLKIENQYRLNTLTKFNLEKAGFTVFYNKETLPIEYSNRCDLLFANVEKENGFLISKLFITLKDCNDRLVFKSEVGKSRDKDYKAAYNEALNEAFKSVNALKYKYSGVLEKQVNNQTNSVTVTQSQQQTIGNQAASTVVSSLPTSVDTADILYAQPTATGYQLIDKTPKVVMKLLKTSQQNAFIAIKGEIQGSLIFKENQWYFEYYKNDVLVSEKINVKF